MAAPAPGLTLVIPRQVSEDAQDPDLGEYLVSTSAFIDHRFHVEPEPGSRRVVLGEDDFLDPAARALHVFLVRPDGGLEQISPVELRAPTTPRIGDLVRVVMRDGSPPRVGLLRALDPDTLVLDPDWPDDGSRAAPAGGDAEAREELERAAVLDLVALDVSTEARFELPPDAGPRPLVRLLYQSDVLSWHAVYQIAPAADPDEPGQSAHSWTVRTWLVINNRTAQALPEARVRLYDAPHRALRTDADPASQLGALIDDRRLALPGKGSLIELPTHEVPVDGYIEHVVRFTDSANEHRVSRELPVEVVRELVLVPLPDHALYPAVPGLARIDLPGEEPHLSSLYGQHGSFRVPLSVSDDVSAAARVRLQGQPPGMYARYRLTASSHGPSPQYLRVIAALPSTSTAELVSVEPRPTSMTRDGTRMTFQLQFAEPDRKAVIEYVVFHPY